MISSPISRVFMAAGIYLLMMWGYVVLPSAQLFAVFAALVMSVAMFFWVTDARELEALSHKPEKPLDPEDFKVEAVDSKIEDTYVSDIEAANQKLEVLKEDLAQQYAQFGRDQSQMNSGGLGNWHPKSDENGNSRRDTGPR